MGNLELFWDASLEELKRGFTQEENFYTCLLCGKKIEKGIVYQEKDVLYEAEKYMRIHIEKFHQSVFEHLIHMDKRLTGLSDHQNGLLRLFYQGKSDWEVQKEMGIGSGSTIRNHRFALREKERQAKVFLVMMELLKEKDKHPAVESSPSKKVNDADDRNKVTKEESEQILKKFFPQGLDGPLKTFSIKEKQKQVVLKEIAKRFQSEKNYSEKEVNEVLKAVYEDHVTLRRHLIDYGFLDRKPDGSQYWLKKESEKKDERKMDRKEELKQMYKETKTQAGVYQIKNTKNQKVYIESTMNIKTINGKRFEMGMGTHKNKLLEKELKEFGLDTFEFEVLEILETKEDVFFDAKDALKKLEEKWLEKIQPFDERGYNKRKQV